MRRDRSGEHSRDVLRCADLLGSFGVTPADVRAQRREYRTTVPPGADDASLETILAEVLGDARDRSALVSHLICRSDRGLSCSARYAQRALGRELEALFRAIGWSFAWARTGPAENGRDRLEFTATDPNGRSRGTTITYPETPLADDNLPAVLRAVDERLLAGTDATLVLLSAGVDRWRAALVETSELDDLRDRYGPRLSAFDRPLLPAHGLEAYVPDDPDRDRLDPANASESDPWPSWALERAERRSDLLGSDIDASATNAGDDHSTGGSLIDEAEPERAATPTGASNPSSTSKPSEQAAPSEPSESAAAAESSEPTATSNPSTEASGFGIRGGSPTVSRVSDGDGANTDVSPRDVADAMLEDQRERETESGSGPAADSDRSGSENGGDRNGDDANGDDADGGFGTLSGSTKTARVTNDSFGTGEEFATADDRYRALGVALGAGGTVTVRGLLEDDDFLPELPAAGPTETRIEFAESFDPDAVETATASAEREGFEWVDSGSLETTRLPDG